MGRITSSVGLVTGLPIAETVDQLIAISARPRDLLVKRTERLQAEQLAVTDLTASVVGVEFAIKGLGTSSLFRQRTVKSSDETLITATAAGTPATSSFKFTPVRRAQNHQLLSSGVASKTKALGGGDVFVQFGGFVDKGISLDLLNDGAGVERGRIRITDRSGASEIIDLRFAQTVDEVIATINRAEKVNIEASADGDRLKLIDKTGQSVSNLQVQDIGSGQTAADLGLSGINVAASEATGSDVLGLYEDLELARLKDGNGVNLRSGVADLEVTLQDGTSLEIEFFAQTKGETPSTAVTSATNGDDAQIRFTSVGSGESFDGYSIRFQDDAKIAVGNETVAINQTSKTITFKIDAGNTRAVDVIAALNNDSAARALFTAAAEDGDGTGLIDVSDTGTTSGGAVAHRDETTLGDVLETINLVDPAKLQARISSSGDQIELVDLTSGAGTFTVSSLFGGTVAEDLGLTTTASNGVITGERRLAGLKTVLLDSLSGGVGLGTLGTIDLTDRSGATATVDLSSSRTLADVVAAINGAGVGISAAVNSARNGITLLDTSGGSGNLVVANGDATETADKLSLAIDDAVASVNSRGLGLQTVNRRTRLDSLNNGRGVQQGSFLITDSQGVARAVNLRTAKPETLGDVIDLINGLGNGVTARFNDSGDGLLLVDTAGGSGKLTVKDEGRGTAALNLKLAGESTEVEINGTPTKVIDGSTAIKVTLDADDTLEDLITQLNAASEDIAASVFSSGSGTKPFRLSLASEVAGAAGELLVDASQLGLSFSETVAAQDALLLVGDGTNNVAAATVTSASNTFTEVIDGVTLTINGTSTKEVNVTVEQTTKPITTQLELFVKQYNALQDKLGELAFFDETQRTAGVLFGSNEVLSVQNDFANLLTSRYFGLGAIQTLEEVGLSVDPEGRLKFNSDEFKARYAADPDAVENFFTTTGIGVSARFVTAAQRLAGVGNSVLVGRNQSLQRTIESNVARITDKTEALQRERERLLTEFYRMEEAISRLQHSLTAIQQIQVLPSLLSLR